MMSRRSTRIAQQQLKEEPRKIDLQMFAREEGKRPNACSSDAGLSPSALDRVASMVVPSYELLRVARRLQSGRPLSITIIGQSNTARNGGCYCDGPSCDHQRGGSVLW